MIAHKKNRLYRPNLIENALARLVLIQRAVPGDIIHLLDKEGECTVNYITEQIGVVQTAVSTFLKKMQRAGYLNCRRDGKYSHYSINYAKMGRIMDYIKIINNKNIS